MDGQKSSLLASARPRELRACGSPGDGSPETLCNEGFDHLLRRRGPYTTHMQCRSKAKPLKVADLANIDPMCPAEGTYLLQSRRSRPQRVTD